MLSQQQQSVVRSELSLSRFLSAQELTYDKALSEIKQGKKTSHWIWYIFPQMRGLGKSEKSYYYGLIGRDEAIAYSKDPVLMARLVEVTQAVLDSGHSVYEIFGDDAIKVYSCVKLFSTISDNPVFKKVMDKYNWH